MNHPGHLDSDDQPHTESRPAPARRRPWLRRIVAFFVGFVLPLTILLASAWATWRVIESAPQVERRGRGEREAILVQVETVHAEDRTVTVEAMGTVRAARSIALTPRVGGTVIEVAPEFMPGGFFAEGEVMLQLDPTDYQLAVQQREAEVEKARSALDIERGQQEIARQEFEMLGAEIPEESRELVLRQPQLRSAQASLAAAENALRQARLDLERTTVRAPFNAVVLTRGVELGSQAGPSTVLAELADADRFWIYLSVPIDDLNLLDIPRTAGERGSPVRLINRHAWPEGVVREGTVLRLSSSLSRDSRLAELIVEVEDPLARDPRNAHLPPLLLNDYLSAEITGRRFAGVIPVDRRHVREGDVVWVMNAENRLEIRPVEIIYRGREEVLIASGLTAGRLLRQPDTAVREWRCVRGDGEARRSA